MRGHQIKAPKGAGWMECNRVDTQLISNYSMPPTDVVLQLNAKNFSHTKLSTDCDCSTGFPVCPASAGGDIPYRPVSVLKTTDVIYDLSGRNVTDWLVKTELSATFFQKRYGGFEFVAPSSANNSLSSSNLNIFLSNYTLFAFNFFSLTNILTSNENNSANTSPIGFLNGTSFVGANPLNSNENVKIWYNTKGYDASVSYLNVLNNAFLRSKEKVLGNDPNNIGILTFIWFNTLEFSIFFKYFVNRFIDYQFEIIFSNTVYILFYCITMGKSYG
jgi:hypothetical protein